MENIQTLITPQVPDRDEKPVAKLILEIQRGNISPEDFPPSEVPFLYRTDVLEGIIESMKRHGQYYFLRDFGKQLGQPFIDMLKVKAEKWYTKSIQNPVDVVWALAKEAENTWYLSLLEKDVNQVVKVSAIKALQGCRENTEILLRIYKRGKAPEKRAALEALAILNPPEAEPVWEKILEKKKPDFLGYVLKCQSPVCMEYRKQQLEEAVEALFLAGSETIEKEVNRVMNLCHCIPEEEELFLKLARAEFGDFVNVNLNRKLIYALEKEGCKELIHLLYTVKPDYFFMANGFLNMITQPVDYFAGLTNISIDKRKEILQIIAAMEYIPYAKKYFTSKLAGWPYPCYPLFKELPDWLLEFLCDDSYLYPAAISSVEYREAYECAEQACRALWRFSTQGELYEKDVKKVRNVAEGFAAKVALAGYTGIFSMEIIGKNPDILGGKSKGILTTYALNQLAIKEGAFTRFDEIKMLALTKKEKLQELYKLQKMLCHETETLPFTVKQVTFFYLERAIKEIEDE